MRPTRLLALSGIALAVVGCSLWGEPQPPPPPEPIDAPVVHIDDAPPAYEEAEPVPLAEMEAALEAAPATPAAVRPAGLPEGIDPADFDLPLHYNDQVQYWIDFFADPNRERFELYLARMGRYENMIREQLREREMPEDLLYLVLVESGFSPRAYSRAHAAGLWQFIPGTGRRYGLEVSHFVDERRDPARSTAAALDYLQDLHERFGSWYLAAAAYNSGENRVERILRRHLDGARGDDTLFWEISEHLPRETRNYVPRILAAGILAKYPDRFGFSVEPHDAESFDVTVVPDATDMEVIAEAAGADPDEIRLLNPHYVRGVTPPGRVAEVRLPSGRVEAFEVAYARIPQEERVRYLEHVVSSGETLSAIAARYGSSVSAIQAVNGIRDPHRISIGLELVIPREGTEAGSPASVHRVQSGDNLWTIARRYGITTRELMELNGLEDGSIIRPGDRLRIQPGS